MNSHTDHQPAAPTQQLSEGDTAAILEDVGPLVFESALGRLLLELNEDQLTELVQLLEAKKEPETLVDELMSRHPKFARYLDEAGQALQEKAEAINS